MDQTTVDCNMPRHELVSSPSIVSPNAQWPKTPANSSSSYQSQKSSGLVWPSRPSAMTRELVDRESNKLGVTLSQQVAIDANVVLKTGANAVGISLQRPFHHF
jgi:hypothetical protein